MCAESPTPLVHADVIFHASWVYAPGKKSLNPQKSVRLGGFEADVEA